VTPWFDGNDAFGAFHSILPKDLSNVPQGISTWGGWEYISYLDQLFYNSWIGLAQTGNLGLCGGLVLTALATRLVFMPLTIYSQVVGHKMRLLGPDIEVHSDAVKRYSKQGNKQAA
jgi:hypothetical protein